MRIAAWMLGGALLIPGVVQGQNPDSLMVPIIQRERTMWQYVKERNFEPFRAVLDSTYTSVTQYGIQGAPLDAARYEWTSLERYELSDFTARLLDSNTVLLTYKADIRGRTLGIRVSGIYWMGTVWRRTNGTWRALFHTEVPG